MKSKTKLLKELEENVNEVIKEYKNYHQEYCDDDTPNKLYQLAVLNSLQLIANWLENIYNKME